MFFYFVELGDLLYGLLLSQFRLHQQCFVEVTSSVNPAHSVNDVILVGLINGRYHTGVSLVTITEKYTGEAG